MDTTAAGGLPAIGARIRIRTSTPASDFSRPATLMSAGITAGFVNFNGGLLDGHMFKIRNGKIEMIQAVRRQRAGRDLAGRNQVGRKGPTRARKDNAEKEDILCASMQITAFAQTNSRCADMTKFKSPGVTLEIKRAEAMLAGRAPGARGARGGPAGPELPAHCRIDGMMDKRTGTDGKTYGIRFAIALPDNWSGQYLQQGGGGLNGTVGEPTGAQVAGDKPVWFAGSPSRQPIPGIRAPAAGSMAASCRISRLLSTSNTSRTSASLCLRNKSSRVSQRREYRRFVMSNADVFRHCCFSWRKVACRTSELRYSVAFPAKSSSAGKPYGHHETDYDG